jgi:hypothetical protein
VKPDDPGRGTPTFDVAEELSRGDTLTSPLRPGFALELNELFVEGS